MLELPSILPLTPVTKLHQVLRDEQKSTPKRKKSAPSTVQPQDVDKSAEHIDEIV